MNTAQKTKTSTFKIAMWSVFGLIGLVVVALAVLPFVINVDKFRPQILQIANQNINGELSIAKLSLSLWGHVEVEISDLELKDANRSIVASAKRSYAQLSFWSILMGSPKMVIKVDKPLISVLRDAKGNTNLLSIMKATPASASGTSQSSSTPAAPQASSAQGTAQLPSLITSAGIDIELHSADFSFEDAQTALIQKLSGFNFEVRDLSMSRPMQTRIWSEISTKLGETITVTGPFNIVGTISPTFDQSVFKQADIDLDASFDELDVSVGEVFKKAKGIATNFKLSMQLMLDSVTVKSFLLNFHNATLESAAKITNIQNPPIRVDFNLKSNSIDLRSWGTMVLPLNAYELEGRLDLAAKANGPMTSPEYKFTAAIKDATAKAPGVSVKPKVGLDMEIVTDELKIFNMTMEAPGVDLKLKASAKNFAAPQFKVQVDSDGLDVDKVFPAPAEVSKTTDVAASDSATKNSAESSPADTKTAAPPVDVDALLDPLRKNETLSKIAGDIAVRMKSIQARGTRIDNFVLDFNLKNLVASIDALNFQVFKGIFKSNLKMDIKPEAPTYTANINLVGLDMQTAIDAQMKSLKNTAVGRLHMKAQGQGASLNSDNILPNLSLNGNLRIEDAKFSSIDVGEMAVGALNKAIEDAADQVPALKDRGIDKTKGFNSKYKQITADFSLRGGLFLSENFSTESYPNEGIDISGRTEAHLLKDELKADWRVTDTYDVTKARNVSANVGGTKVDSILSRGKEPVSFLVHVGCKLSAPCYDYSAVAKELGGIALENLRGGLKQRAGKEVNKLKDTFTKGSDEDKKKAKEKAKEDIKKETDKLKKRFGF